CKDDGNGAVFADDNTLKNIRKDIGLVFQNFNLFPHMSVLENLIESPVNVYKVKKDVAIKKANELLKLVELEDKSSSYPSQLSGGQKQRVAIIRACMLEPKILCFDEPTSALDPSLSNQVSELIKKIAKDQNLGVLIITHDMEFAKNTCDKYIRMENGKIVEEGHPDHV
ncbi:MAG: ATP-binding cassette domain-containing protein, partial [Acidaminobacteraceae bacterium]